MQRICMLSMLLSGAAAICPGKLTSGEHLMKLTVGGREREYFMYVPQSATRGNSPSPAVVMLHGCGSSPEKFELESGMNIAASERGYINVYPKGTTTRTSLGWNAGAAGSCQTDSSINDVDLVRAVLLDLIDNVCVDPARIYAAGFSNGGQMTFNLTCELPNAFAAFSVTGMGQSSVTYPATCGLKADEIRPMVSICGSTDFACASSFSSFITGYASRSACTGEGATSEVSSSTTLTSYNSCGASGSQSFDAYSIKGLGHCWAGNDCCDGQCLNQDPANIDQSRVILDFFDKVNLQSKVNATKFLRGA